MSTRRCEKWRSRGKGPNGLPLCHCGCGREVANKRRTTFEAACWDKWAAVHHPPTVRRLVEARDHGICAGCGCDTDALQKRIANIAYRLFKNLRCWSAIEWSDNWKAVRVRAILKANGFPATLSRSWWEADHIIPVVEGGGECGLDNYRTLCLPCHRKETAALAKRRAEKRKAEKAITLKL